MGIKREQVPYGTPSKAYTNSVADQQSLYPDGQHTIAFNIKCATRGAAAGVGLADACTLAVVRAVNFGRSYITPQLKVIQPS